MEYKDRLRTKNTPPDASGILRLKREEILVTNEKSKKIGHFNHETIYMMEIKMRKKVEDGEGDG